MYYFMFKIGAICIVSPFEQQVSDFFAFIICLNILKSLSNINYCIVIIIVNIFFVFVLFRNWIVPSEVTL